jgi:hypothetical protein
MTRSRHAPPPAASGRRGLAVALLLGLAALVLGGTALAVVLLRGGSGDACRLAAWRSLPSSVDLPPGWSMSASGIYVDSVGTTLTGPAPSSSDGSQPAIFVSVGCYGSDAKEGLARSHDVALAGGSTDIAFPAVGDESVALQDASSGQLTVFVRRDELVASLASTDTTSVDDLAAAARAVDAAMRSAATTAASGDAARGSPAASPPPAASPSVAAPQTPSHAAADLEAQLPKKAGDITLATESYAAGEILGPSDPTDPLTVALGALGKTADDLVIAEAYDETGQQDLYIDAFRLDGVGGSKLARLVIDDWLGAAPQPDASGGDASGLPTSTATVGGKKVTKVSQGEGAPTDYVYVHGDVVFDVGTGDANLAKSILAALP